MHSDEQKGTLQFNCSDVVAKNCDWQVSGNIELEIMMLMVASDAARLYQARLHARTIASEPGLDTALFQRERNGALLRVLGQVRSKDA